MGIADQYAQNPADRPLDLSETRWDPGGWSVSWRLWPLQSAPYVRTRNSREGGIVARYLKRHPEVEEQQVALARWLHERLGPLMVPDGHRSGPPRSRDVLSALYGLSADEQGEIFAGFARLGITPSQWRDDWLARERASCRRPITDEEIPFLEAFGAGLRQFRRMAGLSQAALARLVGCAPVHIEKLEHAVRRPSQGLLCSFADLFSARQPELGGPEQLIEIFYTWLGPALPSESPWKFRVEARRERRLKKKAREEARRGELLAALDDKVEQRAREIVIPFLEDESARRARLSRARLKEQRQRERERELEFAEKEARLRQVSEHLAERAERLRRREQQLAEGGGQEGD